MMRTPWKKGKKLDIRQSDKIITPCAPCLFFITAMFKIIIDTKPKQGLRRQVNGKC